MDYSSASFIVIYVVVIAIGIYIIWCFTLIAKQAGYKRSYGIFIVVPVLNLIIIGIFALKRWPITTFYVKQQQRLIKLMDLVSTTVCDKCGATINEQDKFCSVCGSKLAVS